MQPAIVLFWFRRDLRLSDNAALYRALRHGLPVQPVFIFDRHILDELKDRADRRVEFIHQQITVIDQQLQQLGAALDVRYGTPEEIWPQLLTTYNVKAVYTNHDYEPYARQRDAAMSTLLTKKGISFYSCKDQAVFEKSEVTKDDGKPYTVFTPYARRWKAALTSFYLQSYPTEKYFTALHQSVARPIPSLQSMQFVPAGQPFPGGEWHDAVIRRYSEERDYPAVAGHRVLVYTCALARSASGNWHERQEALMKPF
ncbi:MAG: deoxyribodipyrimidine photo-lyase [Chitinophagaceae bacterium]